MTSKSTSLREYAEDMTRCPICLREYEDPRSLPCLHTFCMKCIAGHCRDKSPGDDSTCPMCREEFKVPSKGIDHLKANFWIYDLSNRLTLSTVGQNNSEDRQNERASSASSAQFRSNIRNGASSSSSSSSSNNADTAADAKHHRKERRCDEHDEVLSMFCTECKMIVCTQCFNHNHRRHKSMRISELAVDFGSQIQTAIEQVTLLVEGMSSDNEKLETNKREFLTKVGKTESVIRQRGEEMKQAIDKEISSLLQQVDTLRSRTVQEISLRQEKLHLRLSAIQTFVNYSNSVKQHGTERDAGLPQLINDIHVRADELQKSKIIHGHYNCIPDIQFLPPTGTLEQAWIGQLHVGIVPDGHTIAPQSLASRDVHIAHKFPAAGFIYGLTVLNADLYALRERDKEQLEVYRTSSYSPVVRHTVHGLGSGMQSIASCERNQCLYISDYKNKCVHRLVMGSTSKWPVNDRPCSLSVTNSFSVLVTCRESRKLKEFTSAGKLLREISLDVEVDGLRHAVQLAYDEFVLCHSSTSVHRVCTVTSYGNIQHAFGGCPATGDLNTPRQVIVDRDGFVFVAEYGRDRVLLLNPTLKFVRDVMSRDDGLEHPSCMFLDAERMQLYVGQHDGQLIAARFV